MIALAAQWSEERRGLIGWLLPASVALHVVVFAWLPSARRLVGAPPPPLVIEVAEAPPPPPPAKTAPPPPDPAPARTAAPAPAAAQAPARAVREVAPSIAPPSDGPLDFTSTVFSNDGPGMAMGGGGTRETRTAPPAPVQSVAMAVSAPPPPRFTPPASLARRPRAPGLDTELERQYPIEARRSGISGTAVLRVRILADGRIGEVRILSESWTGFGPACERTVRAARWEPPIDRDGTPVATEITYTCRFEVRS